MNNYTSHIVRRQYLQIEVNGTESHGLTLQRQMPDVCRNSLQPAIERVLDRWTPGDGYVSIERLEVDAGTIAFERFEHDVSESVAGALEKLLSAQTPSVRPSHAVAGGEIRQITVEQSINEAFLYFLETGRLPWAFHLQQGGTLEQVLLDSWSKTAHSGANPRVSSRAVLDALASVNVRRRLVRQFSAVFLETFLLLLWPEAKKTMDDALQTLLSGAGGGSVDEAKKTKRLVWELVFANMSAGKVPGPQDLVREASYVLANTPIQEVASATLPEHSRPNVTTNGLRHSRRSTNVKQVLESTASLPLSSADANSSNTTDLKKSNTAGRVALSQIEEHSKIRESPRGVREDPDETKEGIYIENAGVIILHPFLPQLFAALDIAAEDKLLKRERAVCLLHFLTTGQGVAPEYELTLVKILCGLPLETPVEADVRLTARETEESVALLESVVHHWGALGDSSADALRSTFLLRSGKLSLRDDGDWLLQVESKTVDILMDHLPWSISMIKLPWMAHMLWVEWQ